MNLEQITLDVEQQIEIKAAIGSVFRGVLHRFGKGNTNPNGESLQLILEEWAGGRWFRDRGDGIQHLWGHVQVIKAPTLLELSGPLFMSYPVINHIEIKLDEISGGTRVSLRHRAIGLLDPAHKEGVTTGWRHMLSGVKDDVAKAAGAQS